MSKNKSYTYVINADNTLRKLLIHDDKKVEKSLVFQRKEYNNIKHPNKNESEDNLTVTQPNNSRDFRLPNKGTFPTKINGKKSKEKNFYNGEVTNFVSRGDNFKFKQGLDIQRAQETKLQQAMDDEEKEFYEISERDRKLFLLKEKCMQDERRKMEKEYRIDLMKKITANEKLREQENDNKMITVERYVLGKQNTARKLEEDYHKHIRDILETRRKEHDLIAFNNALSELKKYDEMERDKLDELNENIVKKENNNMRYRECLKIRRDKRRLDAIHKVAKEKHVAEIARTQWEDTNERAVNKDRLVKRGLSKTLAEKKQVEIDKQRVEKLAEDKKNVEKKTNDYYEAIHNKLSFSDNTEQVKKMNKLCDGIRYRKALVSLMEEEEVRRKNNLDTYEMEGGMRVIKKQGVKPENLPEYVWRGQVWPGINHGK
ncbi:hypothetical protein WDU94_007913 [Cyamophila willieti]